MSTNEAGERGADADWAIGKLFDAVRSTEEGSCAIRIAARLRSVAPPGRDDYAEAMNCGCVLTIIEVENRCGTNHDWFGELRSVAPAAEPSDCPLCGKRALVTVEVSQCGACNTQMLMPGQLDAALAKVRASQPVAVAPASELCVCGHSLHEHIDTAARVSHSCIRCECFAFRAPPVAVAPATKDCGCVEGSYCQTCWVPVAVAETAEYVYRKEEPKPVVYSGCSDPWHRQIFPIADTQFVRCPTCRGGWKWFTAIE